MGLFSFLFGASGAEPDKSDKPKIPLKQLEEMFAGMRAQTTWNLDGDMLWGYFFTDSNPKKLEAVAQQLATDGYHVVGTHQADSKSSYILHVERIETHKPKSLDARNQEFYALAQKFGIESYDGMDVGPAPNH